MDQNAVDQVEELVDRLDLLYGNLKEERDNLRIDVENLQTSVQSLTAERDQLQTAVKDARDLLQVFRYHKCPPKPISIHRDYAEEDEDARMVAALNEIDEWIRQDDARQKSKY